MIQNLEHNDKFTNSPQPMRYFQPQPIARMQKLEKMYDMSELERTSTLVVVKTIREENSRIGLKSYFASHLAKKPCARMHKNLKYVAIAKFLRRGLKGNVA